jgi:hypothetical protein
MSGKSHSTPKYSASSNSRPHVTLDFTAPLLLVETSSSLGDCAFALDCLLFYPSDLFLSSLVLKYSQILAKVSPSVCPLGISSRLWLQLSDHVTHITFQSISLLLKTLQFLCIDLRMKPDSSSRPRKTF